MLGRSSGTSSFSPDFCQLRFQGVSSYGKLIPELASSHMVSITFFPADLAGSEADLRSRNPRPGPGRALGSRETRENGGESAKALWDRAFTHRSTLCSVLSLFSHFPVSSLPSVFSNVDRPLISSPHVLIYFTVASFCCLRSSHLVSSYIISLHFQSSHLVSSSRFCPPASVSDHRFVSVAQTSFGLFSFGCFIEFGPLFQDSNIMVNSVLILFCLLS